MFILEKKKASKPHPTILSQSSGIVLCGRYQDIFNPVNFESEPLLVSVRFYDDCSVTFSGLAALKPFCQQSRWRQIHLTLL